MTSYKLIIVFIVTLVSFLISLRIRFKRAIKDDNMMEWSLFKTIIHFLKYGIIGLLLGLISSLSFFIIQYEISIMFIYPFITRFHHIEVKEKEHIIGHCITGINAYDKSVYIKDFQIFDKYKGQKYSYQLMKNVFEKWIDKNVFTLHVDKNNYIAYTKLNFKIIREDIIDTTPVYQMKYEK